MSTDTNSDKHVHTFKLGEVIDISMINSLYDALKLLINEAKEVVIDAQDVKRLDTSALQLLSSWYRETNEREIKVSWINTEGVFSESSKLLGLNSVFGLE